MDPSAQPPPPAEPAGPRLRGMIGRAGWSIASQGLLSAGNFLFSVVVARETSAAGFGEVSLVFAVYLMVLGVTRGLTGEPLLVLGAGANGGVVVAVAAAAGVVAGLGFAAAAVVFGGFVGPILLAFAVTLPWLLLEDALRHVHVERGDARAAAMLDAAWFAGQVVAVVALEVTGAGIAWFTLWWGAAAAVPVVGHLLYLRLRPDLAGVAGWWRTHGGHGWRFAVEYLAHSSGTHLALLGIAVVSTAVAVAAVRGVQVAMGPFHVLVMGVGLFAVPEGVRLAARSTAALVDATRRLAAGLAGLGVLLGVAVWLVPDAVGEAVLGDTWSGARPVAIPVALGMALNGAAFATGYGLRALNVPERNLRVRVLALVPLFALTVLGAALGDASGAAWGFATGSAVALVLWWREFRAAAGR